MTRLGSLRTRLKALQAGRTSVRWGAALCAAIVAVLVALAVVFLIDVRFSLHISQRLLVIALAIGGVVWAIRKYSLPFLGVREDLTQLALMVERQHDIDSDLVAALQFEGNGSAATANRYGSLQLQSAVIDYVAHAVPSIDVFRGFDRKQMWQRIALAAVSIIGAALLAVTFPDHVQVFFNRLLLGSQHYPTHTQIADVLVNDVSVLARERWNDPLQPKDIACAQSQAVQFKVRITGQIAKKGTVKLISQGAAAARTSIELLPVDTSPMNDEAGTWFSAELGRLVDGVHYTLHIGDTWTDSARISMKPLPVIEPQLTTSPPSYAAGTQPAETTTARQLAVLEGTQIDLTVVCANQKKLTACSLQVKGAEDWQPIPMRAVDDEGTKWVIADDANNPFHPVLSELQYELQVTDSDGLQLESPIRGQIRLRPDRPPVVTASIVHKVVLPTAAPVIDYRATDDFGLSQLKIVVEVQRADAEKNDDSIDLSSNNTSTSTKPGEKEFEPETAEVSLLQTVGKVPGTQLPLAGKFALNLGQLKLEKPLEKGDRARLTVVAVDDRGQSTGREATSEPLTLEISDESGVLSAISEADQQSEEQLNEIIRRQLGIGETR